MYFIKFNAPVWAGVDCGHRQIDRNVGRDNQGNSVPSSDSNVTHNNNDNILKTFDVLLKHLCNSYKYKTNSGLEISLGK